MLNCPGWLQVSLIFSFIITTFGGCLFPQEWSGHWFQYGEGYFTINTTTFGRKGECEQKDGDKYVKYVVYDRRQNEPCRTCLAVYLRHDNVIQYKESNCLMSEYLEELCQDIKGDQPLLTMFRTDDAVPIPCPFQSPPFRFSYSRGTGDCSYPPSRIESCTDDSKLLVTFAACADIDGTESGVEEFNCVASWKEGDSQYLIAKIKKKDLMIAEEEESYRCLMYSHKAGVYQVAQSADATCSTVFSPTDGSKTMLLTSMESSHERCKFPSWVSGPHHYRWHSLDNSHVYHFTHRNASLRVTIEHGPTDTRLACHHLVTNDTETATLVAHSTHGCRNGYVCMVFHKRDDSVIQLQQSDEMVQEPFEACDRPLSSPSTLISAGSQDTKCPHQGHYSSSQPLDWLNDEPCDINTSLTIGCSETPNVISLQTCDLQTRTSVYSCHASWSDNQTTYTVISPISRKSSSAKRYCLILSQANESDKFHLLRLAESCTSSPELLVQSAKLTLQGNCLEEKKSNDCGTVAMPFVAVLACAGLIIIR